MQAKSSVSDYRERGKLQWIARRPAADPKRKLPKLEVVGTSSQQAQLKPGLY
jgi:hypothetical protein